MHAYLVALVYLKRVQDPQRGVDYVRSHRLALLRGHDTTRNSLHMRWNQRYGLMIPMFSDQRVLELDTCGLNVRL